MESEQSESENKARNMIEVISWWYGRGDRARERIADGARGCSIRAKSIENTAEK